VLGFWSSICVAAVATPKRKLPRPDSAPIDPGAPNTIGASSVAVGETVWVAVSVTVGVAVGVAVGEEGTVDEGVAVGVPVAVGLDVEVEVAGATVAVGVGRVAGLSSPSHPTRASEARSNGTSR
jgi:hypothetical protein